MPRSFKLSLLIVHSRFFKCHPGDTRFTNGYRCGGCHLLAGKILESYILLGFSIHLKQAPEMRVGSYDVLKVDIWSLGATVWELAETVPPFSSPSSNSGCAFSILNSKHLGSQWPPLSHPNHYSKGFHDFLQLCGTDAATRPDPGRLLDVSIPVLAFPRTLC